MRGLTRQLAMMASLPLALAACTLGATSEESPSSSPRSTDPSAAFLALIDDPAFSGRIRADMSGTVGAQSVTAEATGEFSGDDSRESAVYTTGSQETSIQDTTVDGSSYKKIGDGPWVLQPKDSSTDPLDRITNLRTIGIETVAGRSLHHLRPPPGFSFLPSDFDLEREGVTDIRGSMDIYVTDDGMPVLLEMMVSWKVGGAKVSLEATMEFSDLGAPISIEAPEDAWSAFQARRYSIAHPGGWTMHRRGRWQYFLDKPGRFVGISLVPARGYTLAELTQGEIAADAPVFGPPDAVEDGVLGGEPAAIVTYHGNVNGRPSYVVVAIAVHGTDSYTVLWVSPSGAEARDESTFQQLLSTFQFT